MTSEARSGLMRLMLRWPYKRDVLPRAADLYDRYEAYSLACTAADLWAKQAGARAALLAEDYRSLVIELEQEIAAELVA